MVRLLVTATPPTPNGDLHLGHLAGPYLAADVLKRHLARTGHSVTYLFGIDDHQSYTQTCAIRRGQPPAQVAAHFGGRIVDAWRDASVGNQQVADALIAVGGKQQAGVLRGDQCRVAQVELLPREGDRLRRFADQDGDLVGVGRAGAPDLDPQPLTAI